MGLSHLFNEKLQRGLRNLRPQSWAWTFLCLAIRNWRRLKRKSWNYGCWNSQNLKPSQIIHGKIQGWQNPESLDLRLSHCLGPALSGRQPRSLIHGTGGLLCLLPWEELGQPEPSFPTPRRPKGTCNAPAHGITISYEEPCIMLDVMGEQLSNSDKGQNRFIYWEYAMAVWSN